jgi:hypothetical protein
VIELTKQETSRPADSQSAQGIMRRGSLVVVEGDRKKEVNTHAHVYMCRGHASQILAICEKLSPKIDLHESTKLKPAVVIDVSKDQFRLKP